ncbi:MAG TPA: penicillin-binding protein 2 [Verrucomicrobiae bacterium]|nr:penicillin-binding protein 2 [Verrucomicrobiae bacterium]
MDQQPAVRVVNPVQRVRLAYALLLVIFAIFSIRLFDLQVINYDHYKKAALNDQLKEYTIPAQRGIITAHLDGSEVPIVLNQELYTLYADPVEIKDPGQVASKLQPIIGGSTSSIKQLLQTSDTEYVVLAQKLTATQNNKILGFQIPGVGSTEQDYRTYPQGSLAAQVLGFVNNNGQGEYGIEQAMNQQLSGKPGLLKAVTDVNGIPLAANPNNVSVAPVNGDSVDLTLNVGIQAGVEKIVQAAQKQYQSKDVSAVVMNVHTGQVVAMANYPSFDPSNYQNVSDPSLFENDAVTYPIEPGSITKLFTVATSLQKGVITPTTGFYDPGSWTIDGATISDVASDHSQGQETILSTLDKSLNTGATWMLMQLGGGQVDAQARNALYDYFSNHFRLGKATGIQQGNGEEASGYVPTPQDNGNGIDLTYAEMSFGQGYLATALQMVSGLSSILNGGTYYQPTLIDQVTSPSGQVTNIAPKVVEKNVVTQQTANDVITLMEENNALHINEGYPYLNFGPNYIVGGKTGTAQIASPLGGYLPNEYMGTYTGFVGGDSPQYAITVYNMEPNDYGEFAGAGAGQPVFADIAHMLINDFGVTPKS